jgi:Cohesin domain
MDRTLYRCFVGAALLMCVSLIGAPIWDWWYYGHSAQSLGSAGPLATIVSPPPLPTPDPQGAAIGANADGHESPVPVSGNSGVESRAPALQRDAPVPTSAPMSPSQKTKRSVGRPADLSGAVEMPSDPKKPETPPTGNRAIPSPQVAGWLAVGLTGGARPPGTHDPAGTGQDHIEHDTVPETDHVPSTEGTSTNDDETPEALRLSLIPSRPAVSRGEIVSVRVVLTDARQITSVPFNVRFNPEVLEYLGAEAGPAFRSSSLQPVLLASVNPSRPGDLAVGLALIGSSGTYTGTGTLVVLQFRALSTGKSDLLFDGASVRGSTGEPLPAAIESSQVQVR